MLEELGSGSGQRRRALLGDTLASRHPAGDTWRVSRAHHTCLMSHLSHVGELAGALVAGLRVLVVPIVRLVVQDRRVQARQRRRRALVEGVRVGERRPLLCSMQRACGGTAAQHACKFGKQGRQRTASNSTCARLCEQDTWRWHAAGVAAGGRQGRAGAGASGMFDRMEGAVHQRAQAVPWCRHAHGICF